jgi:hypothetical protein
MLILQCGVVLLNVLRKLLIGLRRWRGRSRLRATGYGQGRDHEKRNDYSELLFHTFRPSLTSSASEKRN